jgi:hypothetical protein
VAVAWRPSALELEAALTFMPGQHASAAPLGYATFTFGSVVARGCYAFRIGVVVSPCATFELGVVEADQPDYGGGLNRVMWPAPGVALRARWPESGRIAATAAVEGALALYRPEFVVDYNRHVHRVAPGMLRAGLGAEIRFP